MILYICYSIWNNSKEKTIPNRSEEQILPHLLQQCRASAEENVVNAKIESMKKFLMRHVNQEREFGAAYEKYFYLHHDEESGVFVYPEEKTQIIDDELNHCGYFAIVTSEKMSAEEAIGELEKIEMVRQLDGVYRLDHAVTATQKIILKAFGINAERVKYKAAYISWIIQSAGQKKTCSDDEE